MPQCPSLQGEQTTLPAAGGGRALAVERSLCWLLFPAVPGAGLGMQRSLLVSSSSPHDLQAALRNKGGMWAE